MKTIIFGSILIVLGFVICPPLSFSKSKLPPSTSAEEHKAINVIYVQVYDPSGRAVSNLWVELMNELYQSLRRGQTDNSGRIVFSGISSGSFKIKVFTTGTSYLTQTQDVTLINFGSGDSTSSDSAYVDFYLRLDKQKVSLGLEGVTDVVFVQEVPEPARKLFNKGADLLKEDKEAGLIELQKSIDIFPNYYDALNLLGTQFAIRKMYGKAVPHLIKAIEINPRSFSGYYSLGYVSFYLNHRKESIEAFRAATILLPKSVNAQLWYGTVLRLEEKYDNAEKALKLAKTLSKKQPIAEIHWQLALLYNKLERNEEAADELESYLKILPDSPDAKKIKDLIARLKGKNKK